MKLFAILIFAAGLALVLHVATPEAPTIMTYDEFTRTF